METCDGPGKGTGPHGKLLPRDPTARTEYNGDASDLKAALADGSLLGHPGSLEIRETHASLVFLTPTDVYKLKKPLDLGFLNYSTRRRRARMCRLEISLNRRLAPNVYLGVDRVTREKAGHLLNGSGRVVDYLVHMRRVPDERGLDALLRSGAVGNDDARRVGERIGAFHRAAEQAPRSFGPQTFLRNARENLTGLKSLGGAAIPTSVYEEFASYLRQGRSEASPILGARADNGRIRDGHGDLRAEHVYLENGITILDCVEFSERYRMSDTALDFPPCSRLRISRPRPRRRRAPPLLLVSGPGSRQSSEHPRR